MYMMLIPIKTAKTMKIMFTFVENSPFSGFIIYFITHGNR